MTIRPRAVPPYLWFSMILAIEGVILFGLGLALAAAFFVAIWILHSATALFGNSSSSTGERPGADSDDDFQLHRAA